MARARDLVARIEAGGLALADRVALSEQMGESPDPRSEEWCLVQGGAFPMGTDPEVEPDQKSHESPLHRPDVSPFEIMRTCVTVGQVRRFLADGGYERAALWSEAGWAWKTTQRITCPRFFSDAEREEWKAYLTANRPAVGLSWFEADAYARWAGARLPTETEWEKAARGTDHRRYPWGDDWEEGLAGHRGHGPRCTVPVGVFPQGESPYGVLDMAGSVWQWCHDLYAPDAYQHADRRDPTGPAHVPPARASGARSTGDADTEEHSPRVVRGGAWNTLPYSLRCANRNSYPMHARFSNLGFRCARDA